MSVPYYVYTRWKVSGFANVTTYRFIRTYLDSWSVYFIGNWILDSLHNNVNLKLTNKSILDQTVKKKKYSEILNKIQVWQTVIAIIVHIL